MRCIGRRCLFSRRPPRQVFGEVRQGTVLSPALGASGRCGLLDSARATGLVADRPLPPLLGYALCCGLCLFDCLTVSHLYALFV